MTTRIESRREKFRVYATTNPADLGYDGVKSNWLNTPRITTTAKKCIEWIENWKKEIGNVSNAIRIIHVKSGEPVYIQDLWMIVKGM